MENIGIDVQLVVTNPHGEVVHRTSIGLGASGVQVALPLAARCAQHSHFTVTLKHPAIPRPRSRSTRSRTRVGGSNSNRRRLP